MNYVHYPDYVLTMFYDQIGDEDKSKTNKTCTPYNAGISQSNPSDFNGENLLKKKSNRNKIANPSNWTRQSNVEKRKRGLEYHGVKKINGKWHYNVVRPAKEMKPFCNCPMSKQSKKILCRYFSEAQRQQLFNQFWKEFDWKQKRLFIKDMVDTTPTKNTKNRKSEVSRRGLSFVYHLKLCEGRMRVCKKMFLNTLGISEWMVLHYTDKKASVTSNIDKNLIENCSEVVVEENLTKRNMDDTYQPYIYSDIQGTKIVPASEDVNSSTEKGLNKKRKRNKIPDPSSWTRLNEMEKRKKGLEYYGVKKIDGKWHYDIVRPAKEMKPFCDCSMSKKSEKIKCQMFKESDRKHLFNIFWKQFDWEQKRKYIRDMVKISPIKYAKKTKQIYTSFQDIAEVTSIKHCKGRKENSQNDTQGFSDGMNKTFQNQYTNKIHQNIEKNSSTQIKCSSNKKNTTARGVSLVYHLELTGCKIRVCKKLFLNTLRLTDSQVLNWISKNPSENPKVKQKRQNLRNDEKCKTLKNFLHSLPKLESLYCIKHPRKFYLEPVFQTKKEVYNLYIQRCKELEKEHVSIKKFHEEFETHNLAIFSPKTDPCEMCASYKINSNTDEMKTN